LISTCLFTNSLDQYEIGRIVRGRTNEMAKYRNVFLVAKLPITTVL
jgi:hypothetical protein